MLKEKNLCRHAVCESFFRSLTSGEKKKPCLPEMPTFYTFGGVQTNNYTASYINYESSSEFIT